MTSQRLNARYRHLEKLALLGLRVILALVISAMGCSLLFVPSVVDDFEQIGLGPVLRILLGVAHLLGGMALLVPDLAREAAPVLGLFVAGIGLYFHAEGLSPGATWPVVLVVVLLLLGAWLRLRHRVDLSLWNDMLGRYADQEDAHRSPEA